MRFTWAEEWHRLRDAWAGRRFTQRFRRKHSVGRDRRLHRVVYIAGGSLVFSAGVVVRMIPFVPGGSALIAFGAAMVSRESRTAARLLDHAELRLRKLWRWLRGRRRRP